MKEMRGLKIHTFTAAHTSTSCKYNNGVYPWVIQTTLWETVVCQRDTCIWLHNRYLALRFCSLKKIRTKPPKINKEVKDHRKVFLIFKWYISLLTFITKFYFCFMEQKCHVAFSSLEFAMYTWCGKKLRAILKRSTSIVLIPEVWHFTIIIPWKILNTLRNQL